MSSSVLFYPTKKFNVLMVSSGVILTSLLTFLRCRRILEIAESDSIRRGGLRLILTNHSSYVNEIRIVWIREN